MAIKRRDLRTILNDSESVSDEQIKKLLDLIHAEIDAEKDRADEAEEKLKEAEKNGGSNASKWEKKYKDEHKAFEDYKAEQSKKETEASKSQKIKELLDGELDEKGIARVLKHSMASFELDEKGEIKDASNVLKALKDEWSDSVISKETKGTKQHDSGSGSSGGKKAMTKEEILKMTDAGERQQAMAENHELFGF